MWRIDQAGRIRNSKFIQQPNYIFVAYCNLTEKDMVLCHSPHVVNIPKKYKSSTVYIQNWAKI